MSIRQAIGNSTGTTFQFYKNTWSGFEREPATSCTIYLTQNGINFSLGLGGNFHGLHYIMADKKRDIGVGDPFVFNFI